MGELIGGSKRRCREESRPRKASASRSARKSAWSVGVSIRHSLIDKRPAREWAKRATRAGQAIGAPPVKRDKIDAATARRRPNPAPHSPAQSPCAFSGTDYFYLHVEPATSRSPPCHKIQSRNCRS